MASSRRTVWQWCARRPVDIVDRMFARLAYHWNDEETVRLGFVDGYCRTCHHNNALINAHDFPRAAEFRADPRNLAVGAEFPCFRGISRNSA